MQNFPHIFYRQTTNKPPNYNLNLKISATTYKPKKAELIDVNNISKEEKKITRAKRRNY